MLSAYQRELLCRTISADKELLRVIDWWQPTLRQVEMKELFLLRSLIKQHFIVLSFEIVANAY